jgi:transposase
MVLLAAERRMTASEIAEIVRASEETVRRWLKRYLAEEIEGLRDVPHPGAPRKVTEEYRELLVEALRRLDPPPQAQAGDRRAAGGAFGEASDGNHLRSLGQF